MTDFGRICHFLESKSMLDVFAKKCLTLKYLCVYRRANISVFQAQVFVLYMFLSFCICCGKNAGKAPISLKNGYQMIVFSTKRGIYWV